jgi:hypothetical protein
MSAKLQHKNLFKCHKVTNTLQTPLPSWFTAAPKRKWIMAERCKLVRSSDTTIDVNDVSVHSNLIQIEADLDGMVFFCNEDRKYKKYEVTNFLPTLNLWFKDMAGVTIPTDEDGNLDGFFFTFEYMLLVEL